MRLGSDIPRIKLRTGGGVSSLNSSESGDSKDEGINITLLNCHKRDFTVSKRSCQCFTRSIKSE